MFVNDHIWVQCVRGGGGRGQCVRGGGEGGGSVGARSGIWMDTCYIWENVDLFYDRFHHTPIWITRQLSKQDIGQLICQGPILYDRMSTVTPHPSCDREQNR